MEKRDKIGVIVWLCVMLAATIGIEIRERWTWRLFGELQQEDVVSIDVVLGVRPPCQMSKEDQIKVVDCLRQLEVSVDPNGNVPPFIVKDGCMFWHFEMHLQDGSNSRLQIVPYGNIILNEREYLCNNVELKLQIDKIGESYVERISAAYKTAS